MCVFPNIQYVNNFVPLQGNDGNELPPSPRAMFSLLINKGIVDVNFLNNINNMTQLEAEVFDLIDHYPENEASLERIFHLIQIWGGRTGRGIYVNQDFHWAEVVQVYEPFIELIRAFTSIDPLTINLAAGAVGAFHNDLHDIHYTGMGVAFITKHVRFWMHRNLPDDMLPIYGSTFSKHIMQKGRTAQQKDLLNYWKGMVAKAAQEHVSLSSLERQLFNYYK